MKKIISYILKVILAIEAIVVFALSFLAYFTIHVDGKVWHDGLGRKLEEAPILASMIIHDAHWPGLMWFIFDFVMFWISISIGYGLYKASDAIYSKDEVM